MHFSPALVLALATGVESRHGHVHGVNTAPRLPLFPGRHHKRTPQADGRALAADPLSSVERMLDLVTESPDTLGPMDAERDDDVTFFAKIVLGSLAEHSKQLAEHLGAVPFLGKEESAVFLRWETGEQTISYINEVIFEPAESKDELPALTTCALMMLGLVLVTFEIFAKDLAKELIADILTEAIKYFHVAAVATVPLAGIVFAVVIAAIADNIKTKLTGEESTQGQYNGKLFWAAVGGIHPASATLLAASTIGNIMNGLFAAIEPKCPALEKAEAMMEAGETAEKQAKELLESKEILETDVKRRLVALELQQQQLDIMDTELKKFASRLELAEETYKKNSAEIEKENMQAENHGDLLAAEGKAVTNMKMKEDEVTKIKAARDRYQKSQEEWQASFADKTNLLTTYNAAVFEQESKAEIAEATAACLTPLGKNKKDYATSFFKGAKDIAQKKVSQQRASILAKVWKYLDSREPDDQTEEVALDKGDEMTSCLAHNKEHKAKKIAYLLQIASKFIKTNLMTGVQTKGFSWDAATLKVAEKIEKITEEITEETHDAEGNHIPVA